MKGWVCGVDGIYYTHVYDRDHNEVLSAVFNPEDRALTVGNIVLNDAGTEKLRKLLQQVKRYPRKEG